MKAVFIGVVLTILAGPIIAADTVYPLGAVRTDGVLYVIDRKLPGIWHFASSRSAPYFAGSKKFRTPLNAARCIALDKDGNILAGDSSTREIYRFVRGEDPTPVPLTDGGIGIPMSIAVDDEGTIFVADLELHRIFKVPHEGGTPEELAAISAPRGLAFNSKGELIVVSTTANQLLRIAKSGEVNIICPGRPFNFPHNVAVGPDDVMYVTDGYGKCVWKVTPDGEAAKFATDAAFSNPVGITMTGDALLVTDPRANAVFEVTLDGKVNRLTPE